MEEKRILWVDYAKSIGIFLVVLGHTTTFYPLRSLIYSFHIPLFFFISGFLFSFEKYPNFKTFFKRRFSQLVIPYVIFNLITYIFWVFIGRNYGQDAVINIYKPILGIIYANLSNNYLEHCPPLWFLACLFSTEIIYYIVFRNIKSVKNSLLIFLIFAIVGFLDYKFNKLSLPWGINISFSVIFIYGLGNILHKFLSDKKEFKTTYLIITLITGSFLLYLISNLNGKIEISTREYGNYFYYIIGAATGIIISIIICMWLFKKIGFIQWMEFIGSNTLTILALHLMASTIIKGVMFYVFKLDIISFRASGLLSVLFSLGCIIVLIPVIKFFNKYTPFLIGKKKYETIP